MLIPDFWTKAGKLEPYLSHLLPSHVDFLYLISSDPESWNKDIILTLERAEKVAAADLNGLSDPYVNVSCVDKSTGQKVYERTGKLKTGIKDGTLSPTWNADFLFPNGINSNQNCLCSHS